MNQQPCRTCGTCPSCGNRPAPSITQPFRYGLDWTYYPPTYISPYYPYTSPNIMWSGRSWTSDTTSPLDLQSGMASALQNGINIGSGKVPTNPTTDTKIS
jgi:hypothetical protein